MIASPYGDGTRLRRRTRSRGIALPVVLLISAMMLATSAAWFEQSVAVARNTAGMHDHLIALHAADAALSLCARNLVNGPTVSAPGVSGEPIGWKLQATFEANAIAPFMSWPASLSFRAPQCLIESWQLTNRPNAHAYLVTARGYGRKVDSQMWLQLQLVIQDGVIEKHWRRVAARPF
jgi:Tfp pilus assembly protein PilX